MLISNNSFALNNGHIFAFLHDLTVEMNPEININHDITYAYEAPIANTGI